MTTRNPKMNKHYKQSQTFPYSIEMMMMTTVCVISRTNVLINLVIPAAAVDSFFFLSFEDRVVDVVQL